MNNISKMYSIVKCCVILNNKKKVPVIYVFLCNICLKMDHRRNIGGAKIMECLMTMPPTLPKTIPQFMNNNKHYLY